MFFSFSLGSSLLYLLMCLFLCLCFLYRVEHTRVSSSSLPPDDDPLMVVVNLLPHAYADVRRVVAQAESEGARD
jgi:hypothetical protein